MLAVNEADSRNSQETGVSASLGEYLSCIHWAGRHAHCGRHPSLAEILDCVSGEEELSRGRHQSLSTSWQEDAIRPTPSSSCCHVSLTRMDCTLEPCVIINHFSPLSEYLSQQQKKKLKQEMCRCLIHKLLHQLNKETYMNSRAQCLVYSWCSMHA